MGSDTRDPGPISGIRSGLGLIWDLDSRPGPLKLEPKIGDTGTLLYLVSKIQELEIGTWNPGSKTLDT